MQSKIRVLSEHTINKIAAGEVIENPSSVVKELVENSLDAGATDICVEIKGGGRQMIRVTDNGCGMSSDDALLCLERHATSKIKEVEDLHTIWTMGFRGEAIPSIASISKFTLLTCPNVEGQPAKEGTMVLVDGGKIMRCCPAACAPGTTIEVKSLFFNIPVRKKFQKSPAYDTNEILKVLSLQALANPGIKFQLISNQETLLSAPLPTRKTFEGQLGERAASVLGNDFFESTCPLEGSKGECHLQGVIGLPGYTRQNRTGQYLFINKRAVSSPFVAYAIREAYGPTIGTHRYPVFVLHLTLPGHLVDVNVHPQKREVRLRQEMVLKDLIVQSVEKALQQAGSSPFIELGSTAHELPRPQPLPFTAFVRPLHDIPQTPALLREESKPVTAVQAPIPSRMPEAPPVLFKESPKCVQIPRVIATIANYILIDPSTLEKFGNEGLCLVDQRAAHSRIIYEKLAQAQSAETQRGNLQVQSLLIPYTLETTTLESSLLREQLESLNALGISIKEFGPNTFAVDALPQVFGNTDLRALLTELVQRLRDFQDSSAYRTEQVRLVALAASRAAVAKNKRLPVEEAQALLSQLMNCQMPYQCPLGKPIMAQIKPDDLARHFNKFI